MELIQEWKNILNNKEAFYIYGAGKVGKRIWNLIKSDGKQQKVKGFVVSRSGGNPSDIEGVPVFLLDEIEDKNVCVLVSVTDIYQLEIMDSLKECGFENIVCAYKYSFLNAERPTGEMPNTITIDIRELLVQQFFGGGGNFSRLDIIVRLLAAEDYYTDNGYGFCLYRKMQNLRVKQGYAVNAERRYRALMESVDKNGYDRESEIIVDKNLHLLDGSHRIALAIYHEVPCVKIRILNREKEVQYGIEWFSQNFSMDECKILEDKLEEISQKWFCPMKGIIWPPVSKCFSEVTALIDREFGVSSYMDYEMPQEIFTRFVRGVYHIDDIADWKIEAKLEHMKSKDSYRVRVVDINMRYPDFRVKWSGKTISVEGEKLKKLIRDSYRGMVERYFYDIVFHTSDNYWQSEYIQALTDKAVDLPQLFERISKFDWMLIKTENDYFPKDFPASYPAYKDIDVICRAAERKDIEKEILMYFAEQLDKRYTVRVTEKLQDGSLIRIELQGFLIFQIDLSSAEEHLCENFIEHSLDEKISRGNYWICGNEDEIIYRIIECYTHPVKEKHLQYVQKNWKDSYLRRLLDSIQEPYREDVRDLIQKKVMC